MSKDFKYLLALAVLTVGYIVLIIDSSVSQYKYQKEIKSYTEIIAGKDSIILAMQAKPVPVVTEFSNKETKDLEKWLRDDLNQGTAYFVVKKHFRK